MPGEHGTGCGDEADAILSEPADCRRCASRQHRDHAAGGNCASIRLSAGVRPARLRPGVPSPIVGADRRGIDSAYQGVHRRLLRRGEGASTKPQARETAGDHAKKHPSVVQFSFVSGGTAQGAGRPGRLTCATRPTLFKAFGYFREMFEAAATGIPRSSRRLYVRRLLGVSSSVHGI